jgi:hypothetical protein
LTAACNPTRLSVSVKFPAFFPEPRARRCRKHLCGWQRAYLRFLVLALCAVLLPVEAAGQDPPSLRLFLTNGATVEIYGEYTRVSDRVVFAMKAGSPAAGAELQMMSLSADVVDWEKTSAYADTVRFHRYRETRGEADFLQFTHTVADALDEIARTRVIAERLAIAERTRRYVANWPAAHYGYRAPDVQEIAALVDATISELRAEAGASTFDLALVAMVAPPTGSLLPPPTLADAIAQALGIARTADVPAERVALIRRVIAWMDESRDQLPKAWAKATRREAERTLSRDLKVDREYVAFTRAAMAEASQRAARADVRGVERVMLDASRRDRKLGGKRPETANALMKALAAELDAARQLRLARDHWASRARAFRAYRSAVAPSLRRADRVRPWLEEIKGLSGPASPMLVRLSGETRLALSSLEWAAPPVELSEPHGLLTSAFMMAAEAARGREAAIATGDLRAAWDASSAAAASLMLFDRARAEIERHSKRPELR